MSQLATSGFGCEEVGRAGAEQGWDWQNSAPLDLELCVGPEGLTCSLSSLCQQNA